ncbi:unnamed protein product [Diatraea saccharalis]|uniref:Beta-glucosidase n=1 Tax=Diatraea saccharalis TaxID=40085 RepID=A0A9P0G1K5_9NEOP|nr:unnamed protein product [Diatraea saccharalis]
MLREVGVDFYRFSLSWPRILPTGFPDEINQAGVDYYNNLIDELLKYNIQPMVTLYHWDLPQKLQELGGWANPHSVDWFGDFAKVAFNAFGDRVKLWVTINEPTQICYNGYGNGQLAPFLTFSGVGDYMCAKYLLLAHARAYHIYNEEFRSTQQGSIFITYSAGWQEPASDEDVAAAQEAVAFDLDQYAYPIFSKSGGWHPLFQEIIAKKSAEQGFLRSRLPELSDEEIKYLQGTSDYFGLNHYSTYIIYRNQSVSTHAIPSREDDLNVMWFQPAEWWLDENDTVKSAPWGFRKLLQYIREQYDNPPVYVTENGCSSLASIDDDNRVSYYRGYLGAMLDAIAEGSDVRGYTAWSLMDNFEWRKGYTEKFGIYEVDFTSPERTRTPRKSAFVYKEILRSRTLDYNYEPDTTVMTIDEGH